MDIVPYFSELAKQGQTGRNQLNKITRILGLAMAFIQGYMFSFAFIQDGSVTDYLSASLVMTAGTAFLLWIGDQITKMGLGNGISMIIMAGILASIPNMFGQAFDGLVNGSDQLAIGIISFAVFVIMYFVIAFAILYVQLAERRIPVQYANKTNNVYGSKKSYLPFKINPAGVAPVIFASALISVPALIAQFTKNEDMMLFVNKWLSLSSVTGMLLFLVFIIGFTYFYMYVVIKPKEMSEDLQKSGGYIPGIRPGVETANYVKKVLNRVTFIGAISLMFIAALPVVLTLTVFNEDPTLAIGGTGLIIVVGVALELNNQINGLIAGKSYDEVIGGM